mmetsp:Transcript_27998/g.39437  ORF Transcript_27998/g.39437 Transcript_27998/m.39437 type:complete len:462 (+) Transcript_27998:102-1487(+)
MAFKRPSSLLHVLFLYTPWYSWAVIPSQNPPWPPTYDMHESLITMQCNSSGFSSPHRGSQFGIVSYDWSNAKSQWAATTPMNCEEILLQQAQSTKQAGGKHVFVYRNIVKALPWFRSVREKLDDPAFDGFFLKFDQSQRPFHVPDCAPEKHTHCSEFYHDQEQTPEVPTPSKPHPDGYCIDRCDCGIHPCGEYLFDHRNGTMLREWIVKEVILGEAAVGNPSIDGLFLDDYWCSNVICDQSNNKIAGCPCDDPVQGPTEIDSHSQNDMGLTDQDIYDITVGWNQTMSAVQQAILERDAYTWSLIPGQENANAMPLLLSSDTTQCISELRDACTADSIWQYSAVLFGFTVNGTALLQLQQDLSFFLLARGPYAYAGWGVWGMTWPFNPEPGHGQLPPMPNGVPLPSEFDNDYGVPEDICFEYSPGIFHREWTHASIELDCNKFTPTIKLKESFQIVEGTSQT